MSTRRNRVRKDRSRDDGEGETGAIRKSSAELESTRTPIDRGADEYTEVVESGIEALGGSYRLLVPVLSESPIEDTERLMRTAATIARDRNGEVLALSLVRLPEQTPLDRLSSDDPSVRTGYEGVERLLQAAVDASVPAEGIVCLTHREARSILNMAAKYECDGVILPVRSDRSQRRRLLTGDAIERIVARAEADVFVEKLGPAPVSIERVLLAAGGGPHAGLAAETARALARATDAHVDVVHFLGPDPTEDDRRKANRILQAAKGLLGDVECVETEAVSAKNAAEGIITRSEGYDVTVLGAPTRGLLSQFVLGTVPDSVGRGSENAVLVAKRNTGRRSAYYRWIAGETERESGQ